jgi:hypothetical protein
MTKNNAVNWFELYVTDLKRAQTFYEAILQSPMQEATCGPCQMVIFPYDNMKGVGGALTKMEGFAPGGGGTLVYLNVEGDLDGVISRIPPAGGTILRPRFPIGEHGFIAIFKDTEGNVVGLHTCS